MIVSICIHGFVFSLRTTFVGVLLEPTVFRVVSTFSTIPTFNRLLALVLVLVLVLVLSVLVFALFVLCQMHLCPLGRLLLGVMSLSVSCFVHLRDLHSQYVFEFFSQNTIRNQSRTIQLYVFLEIIWQQSLQGNSCECLPQENVHFLGHLVGYWSVSRDLRSSRWRTSVQATLLASATESPSRDFVLVPLCTGSTFRAACANSRSLGHLLMT